MRLCPGTVRTDPVFGSNGNAWRVVWPSDVALDCPVPRPDKGPQGGINPEDFWTADRSNVGRTLTARPGVQHHPHHRTQPDMRSVGESPPTCGMTVYVGW